MLNPADHGPSRAVEFKKKLVMPIRIYEIAKKLNLESKFVLVKAKELGIAAAKVPSSSLDKITGEYLEEQLRLAAKPSGGASFGGASATSAEPPSTAEYPAAIPTSALPEPPAVVLIPAPEPMASPPLVELIRVPEPQSESYDEAVEMTEISEDNLPETEAGAPDTTSISTVEPANVEASGSPPPPEPPKTQLGQKVGSIDLSKFGYGRRTGGGNERREEAKPSSGPPRPGQPAGPGQRGPGGAQPARPPAPAAAGQRTPAGNFGNRGPGGSGFGNRGTGGAFGQRGPGGQSGVPGQRGPSGPGGAQGQRSPGGPGSAQGQQRGPGSPGGAQGQGQRGSGAQGGAYGQRGTGGLGGSMGQRGQVGGGGRDDRRDDRSGLNRNMPGFGAAAARSALSEAAPSITVRPPIVVRELAEKMGKKPFQIIADLMQMGVFATVTQSIDTEVAIKLCARHGIRFETEKRDKSAHSVNVPREEKVELDQEDTLESLKPRPPVITIMGHVDHGKTTLLDKIRKANVAAGESGGITQHIGAYTIAYPHPITGVSTPLTFLDTPGHAAFSAMRARGANVTDIVILVVAANDGVMPQTIEALSHAQAAKVPIMVAVNKCDHPAANPMKVKQQLQDRGLIPDDWGGDTLYVECSGLTGVGVEKLIEAILLQAELQELKANHDRKAKGNVIESGVEPGGPVATVLIRKGTLHLGDVVISGEYYGRVRAMMNEDGQRLKIATPSFAVRVLGLNGIPEAGSEFSAVENERAARDLAEERFTARKKAELDGVRPKRQSLEDLFGQINDLTAKVLKVIVKADNQGSVEAICEALRKSETKKVGLDIIHYAVGAVTESDVLLAASGDAVILGFHTRVDSSAAEAAKREGVQIKLYAIIYELIDHVKEAMAGLLDPLLSEVPVGAAEVRKVFELSKGGKVAGCYVTSGTLVRGKMRVRRQTHIIFEGVSRTLKRFQDEVNEVRVGMECGLSVEGFDDLQEGDVIECYAVEKTAAKLE